MFLSNMQHGQILKNIGLMSIISFPFSSITVQGLIQCGTPDCFGSILQIIRTGNVDPLVADAVTYSLGLLPFPCTKRIREILNMAQYQQSRATFYALSHAVTK